MAMSVTQSLTTVGWFWVVWVGSWGAIAFPLFRRLQWRPFTPIPTAQKLGLLMPLYGLAWLVVWGANQVLAQSWQALGVSLTSTSLALLGVGIVIALGGLFLFLWLKHSLGLVRFSGRASSDTAPSGGQRMGTALLLLLIGLWIGGAEELVFRGWMQTQLELGLAPWLAAVLASVVFALAHLVWDGPEGWWQQPGLFLLGGVLVVARWAVGGNLALAWGLHAGWVWGLALMDEWLKPEPHPDRPVWLTGRPDQPLTSLLDWAVLAGTAGLVWAIWGA